MESFQSVNSVEKDELTDAHPYRQQVKCSETKSASGCDGPHGHPLQDPQFFLRTLRKSRKVRPHRGDSELLGLSLR